MKIFFILPLLTIVFQIAYSQNVGIGTNSPNASAILDISSTTKGLLAPRMTNAQMNAIATPAVGLLIYNTTDSSYYTRRPGGWAKMNYGQDNVWKHFGNNIIYSPTAAYVGINYADLPAANIVGAYAPLQTRGMVGNTLALFGEDNRQGISLVGNYPGVFFNSYFNNGVKSIAAGATGNITLNQQNPPYYEFSFGDYTNNNDQPVANNIKMALRNDGHMYVGNSSIDFSRAAFEQQGSTGTTAAIFGGDGAGVSLQKNWPVVGFNHYFDGVNHKSIGQGYNGLIGVNQTTGNLYIACFKDYAAIPNANLTGYTERIYFSRFGNIGIASSDPQGDLTITTPAFYIGQDFTPLGLRLNNAGSNNFWNVFADGGVNFAKNGSLLSYINENDGSYVTVSDANRKKNIATVQSNTLQQILLLNPVKYLLKEEVQNSKLHIGFISQEVEKIFPELVHDNKGNKFLNYTAFIPLLTKGMQEQQQQIEELKNEVAELKKLLLNK